MKTNKMIEKCVDQAARDAPTCSSQRFLYKPCGSYFLERRSQSRLLFCVKCLMTFSAVSFCFGLHFVQPLANASGKVSRSRKNIEIRNTKEKLIIENQVIIRMYNKITITVTALGFIGNQQLLFCCFAYPVAPM